MLMTRQNLERIKKSIEESLSILYSVSRVSKKEFLASRDLQDKAKWNFYVVVQGCLDFGNHIIAIKRFDAPESYEDIISILEKKKIISKGLVSVLRGMGGFRNLIAHGYFKIDLDKLYSYLKKTQAIKKFIRELSNYL